MMKSVQYIQKVIESEIEVAINDKANEIIEQLFESLLSRYQSDWETSMKGSDFLVFIYCITNVIKNLNVTYHT